MNPEILRLYQMANAPSRRIIGLMSGTSLDGLDIACCHIQNFGLQTKVYVEHFETIPYSAVLVENIKSIFASKTIDFPFLVGLNEWLGNLHGDMVNDFLDRNHISKSTIDVIASHGQTVMHVPRHQGSHDVFPNATLQIGDGDHIAVKTGIITISDFRQKHLAAGGEGAPLAVYGDYLLFSKLGESRIMLNIGGISNFTFLPADGNPESVFVTDTGPGNTMMDAYMRLHFSAQYDDHGKMAASGNVNNSLLTALKSQDFFKHAFPKSTGPEIFNLTWLHEAQIKSQTLDVNKNDVMATLNRFSAETIAMGISNVVIDQNFTIFLSGGGAHNTLLVNHLKELFPKATFRKTDDLGINGDAKEAVLFAVLANETLAGKPISLGNQIGIQPICMGKISLPK